MEKFKRWLNRQPNIPRQYEEGLELQVIVAQDDGERDGKGFKKDDEKWFNVRLQSTESKIRDIYFTQHIEAVGMTGWDYKNKVSRWVGFDFDSIVGHKQGLTEGQLNEIIEKAKTVPYIEIRRSTSGKGLHFYIPIEKCPEIGTRTLHITLAKNILSNLSALLNFDFKSKVDGCGGVLWVWSRRMGHSSFSIVKEATSKFDASTIELVEEKEDRKSKVKELTANLKYIDLSTEHRKLLEYFSAKGYSWYWDAELNMLVTHTYFLSQAHTDLKMKGVFYTNSEGKGGVNDRNCFAFPMRNGAWIVRRYHPNTQEHEFWKTDKSGWTYCFFNRIPTLDDLHKIFEGAVDSTGKYVFPRVDCIREILKYLSPTIKLDVPEFAAHRQYKIKVLKDAKIAIITDKLDGETFKGWIAQKKTWEKVIPILEEENEVQIPDNVVRHVIGAGKDAGWFVYSTGWINEPRINISSALVSMGYPPATITEILGQCILKPWSLVVKPFQPEYTGNREWNKFGPQLLFSPAPGTFSLWTNILEHLGKNLTQSVLNHPWCKAYNITTGGEYLKYWLASMFKYPNEPLPYLFFYGPQGSGKSTLHESIALLVNKGVVKADNALTSQQRFNGELAGAILCAVEETNLKNSKGAYERIKEWVTGKTISIHPKTQTPFDIDNTTHWVQCANSADACPVAVGDTRICVIRVDMPLITTPKSKLQELLKIEAPAFLYELLNLEIPAPVDRLRIPLVETEEKKEEQIAGANLVEQFIYDECNLVNGHFVSYSDFIAKFHQYLILKGGKIEEWSAIKIGRSIPLTPNMPVKGRYTGSAMFHLGNISFDKEATEKGKFVKDGERIKLIDG